MEKSYQGSRVEKEGIIYSFLFPNSYTLHRVFMDTSVDDMTMAFNITQNILTTKDKLCLDEYASVLIKRNANQQESTINNIMETNKEEKNKLKHQYESEVSLLRKQIATLEVSLREARASEDIVKERYQEQADKRIEDLNKVSEKLLASQKEFAEKWERECERLRSENKSLQEQIQARNILQQNSSKKGRYGEKTFESIAKELKGWVLDYTGDESHAGDYHARIQNANVMFEIKGHDILTIPGKELEKFRNDMRTHSTIDVGVFVALNSKIPYMHDITIERSPTNQYLIFIPLFLQQDLTVIFNFLEIVFQIIMVYRTLLTKTSTTTDEVPVLKEQIHRATNYTQNILTRMTTTMKHFTEDSRALQDKLDTLSSHIKTNMAAQVEDIKSLLSILSGQDVEQVVEEKSEVPQELPVVHGEVKKKRKGVAKKKKEEVLITL